MQNMKLIPKSKEKLCLENVNKSAERLQIIVIKAAVFFASAKISKLTVSSAKYFLTRGFEFSRFIF